MEEKLLTREEVKGYSHSLLVGDFVVASRRAFDDGTASEREMWTKNLNILREELYNRLPSVRDVT